MCPHTLFDTVPRMVFILLPVRLWSTNTMTLRVL